MKLNLKNVFLSVGIFAFTLALVGALSTNKVYANTCTATVSGDWHTTTNWGGCGGVLPQPTDDVVIPGNKVMTLSGDATAASISVSDPVATGNNGISNFNGHTLTVGAGGVTFVGSSGASNSTIAVGSGTLTATGNIAISGGAVGNSVLNVSTGTINVVTITMSGFASAAQLTSTGASNINISGNITGGTLDDTGGMITFTGAGAHNPGNYATGYNNVAIVGGGTVTLPAGQTTTLAGTLTINSSGTLNTVDNALTVTGVSNIYGTITFTTGAKVFTGYTYLYPGSVWNETGASTFTFGGNFTNNANSFTASTGLHTFNGTGTLSGGTTTSIGSVTFSTGAHINNGILTVPTLLTITGVTLTNNGTITATTSLTGAGGTLLQGPNGVLNIGNTIDTITLDVSDAGNTVNYTKAGNQIIFDPAGATFHTYYNLGLSGSGTKTLNSAALITHDLTIGGTATVTLASDTVTSNRLYFGTTLQRSGTWGALASSATYKTDTQFTTTINQYMTVATGSGSSSVTTSGTFSWAPSSTTTTTPVTCTLPQVLDASTNTCVTPAATDNGCSGGNKYNTSTGAVCVNNVGETAHGTYAFGTKTLKNGSRGEAVMELQRFLNAKLNLGLVVDGKLGPKTIAVIKQWQKDHGLVADGLVGAKTKAKMNAEAN